MEIKEFVKKILNDLDSAVEEVNAETKRTVRFSATKDHRTVEFDVAVSVVEQGETKGRAGIRVLEFVEAGGNMNASIKNATVSRVKFGVVISPQTKEEEIKNERQYQIAAQGNDWD
jgi:hypothetical protein